MAGRSPGGWPGKPLADAPISAENLARLRRMESDERSATRRSPRSRPCWTAPVPAGSGSRCSSKSMGSKCGSSRAWRCGCGCSRSWARCGWAWPGWEARWGVDWGRCDFLRRAGGALIAQITLSILGSPKSVKVKHEPASPKPPAEISVEPADAHTYTQMLRHAFNNTHVLRISWFLKAQGFAPYESPSVMRIRESNKLVRTVAIHRYVTDGQEAVLAYGEEVSGLVWAYAIVIPELISKPGVRL
jgi:hypothetical protein